MDDGTRRDDKADVRVTGVYFSDTVTRGSNLMVGMMFKKYLILLH